MRDLDGVWRVHRESGLLPPMVGVGKIVTGGQGSTRFGPLRAGFDVVGTVRSPIRGAKGNAEVLAVLRPARRA